MVIIKADITEQKVWSDMARAYEKVIIRTSFYEKLMKEIADHLDDCQYILDMGCGVGYLINMLLENPNKNAVGVDANKYMLDIAEKEIINKEYLERVKLVQADATTFDNGEKFDAVVSSNLLFNLKDPRGFLNHSYGLLKHEGRLVLTSAKDNADLDVLINAAIKDFKERGMLTDELLRHIQMVQQGNKRFIGKAGAEERLFSTFGSHEIERELELIGFKVIYSGLGYLDQNFFVVGKKQG